MENFEKFFKKAKKLYFPLENREVLQELRAGAPVLIYGWILCGRDATHRKILESLKTGEFSFNFKNQAIYYVGPTQAPPGKPIGSAGTTTSSRKDAYMEEFLKLGICATIGKGKRSYKVVQALKEYKAVYLATFGGAGAFLSNFIEKMEPIAWEDLGPEAFFRIKVKNFPAIVINSIYGEDYYEQIMNSLSLY